jgi:catechol 2,3-dioxygenase-like lactoylglutathione lyase family enzyme
MLKNSSILLPVEFECFDRTVRFYTEILEFKIIESGESDLGNPWCSFDAFGVTVTIHTGRDGIFPYPEFRPTGHGLAFAFEVVCVDSAKVNLRKANITLLNSWEYKDGSKAFSIVDPSGNLIELWGWE